MDHKEVENDKINLRPSALVMWPESSIGVKSKRFSPELYSFHSIHPSQILGRGKISTTKNSFLTAHLWASFNQSGGHPNHFCLPMNFQPELSIFWQFYQYRHENPRKTCKKWFILHRFLRVKCRYPQKIYLTLKDMFWGSASWNIKLLSSVELDRWQIIIRYIRSMTNVYAWSCSGKDQKNFPELVAIDARLHFAFL